MGILPLASPPAIDNAGDESAHFRNGMRRERVWRVRGEAELCAAWRANSHDYAGLLGECWIPVPLPPPPAAIKGTSGLSAAFSPLRIRAAQAKFLCLVRSVAHQRIQKAGLIAGWSSVDA